VELVVSVYFHPVTIVSRKFQVPYLVIGSLRIDRPLRLKPLSWQHVRSLDVLVIPTNGQILNVCVLVPKQGVQKLQLKNGAMKKL
jgi:hypothetical protein